MIGQVVSHYKILEKLGEGGMGVVYKAQDLQLNRFVALKFLPPAMQNDPTVMARLLHEAQAISTLNHPQIATIHSLEEHFGQKFIVLEYLEGGTLKAKLKEGRFPVNTVVDYGVQIGEGLAHAHKRGIVHRDLKTENIMLTGEGRLKITDFGLARLQGMTKVTRTGSAVGTAAYTSPEQAKGEEADSRSDIFSFGVILYELMTGKLPFKGEHEAAILYGICHETPQPMYELRADMPATFGQIVEKAMEKKAAKRYQQVENMLGELRAVSASGPPVSRWSKILKKKSRWLIPIVALLLVSLIPIFKRYFLPTTPVSVAVLPFEVTGSSSEENVWLAEGIGQSIATKLTKLKDVRVTPWVTSQRYQSPIIMRKDSLKSVASELGVERLLIGTIRILGERVHAAVQLIDQTGNQQIWSDEFDERKADIFEVYKKIALGVAEGLKGNFSGEEEKLLAQPPAQRFDAYDFYVRGSLKLQSETPEDDDVALAYFDKAVELDPQLAEAYVGRGSVYAHRFFNGWGGKVDLNQAEEDFKKALELEPKSTSARRGLIGIFWELGASEEVLKQGAAIPKDKLNDVAALSIRAEAYTLGGLPDKAVPLYERILQLDRANQGALWHLVIALVWSLQAQKAINAGEQFFERFGDDPEIYTRVAEAYVLLGDLDAAKIHIDRALELFGNYSTAYTSVLASTIYGQLGDTAKATSLLIRSISRLEERLKANPSNFRMAGQLANLYALLGNYDKAEEFAALARQYSPGTAGALLLASMRLLMVGRYNTARSIVRDILSNGSDFYLDVQRRVQWIGAPGKDELSALKNEGFLDKQVELDAKYRAKY